MAARITIERRGARIYFLGDTYAARDQIKDMGGHWDSETRQWWVGATKLPQALALTATGQAADPDAPKTPEDPDNIRLTGKGTYKGKTYFMGASTRDGSRVRLLTLPDSATGKYLDFWADAHDVERTKTYLPRQEQGYRGRPGKTIHQTLGSIARYVRNQETAKAEGIPACPVCGKRGPLHYDMEDGCRKCYGCCDMPE